MGINEPSRSIRSWAMPEDVRESKNGRIVISVWDNWLRTRKSNNKQMVSPEDPNFLGKCCERLEPGRLENTVQEATILIRISFR